MRFNYWSASVWACATVIILQYCAVNGQTTYKTNKTQHDVTYLSRRNYTLPRRLPSPWRHGKLPALPPRLRNGHYRLSTTTTTTTQTPVTVPTSSLPSSLSETSVEDVHRHIPRRRIDEIASASSENNHLSVVWPVRVRQLPFKRFRAPTPTTPAPKVLLKLLQPKPTRPAIYSLDGFVPKPSIQKFVTTEPPYAFRKNDLQVLSSVPRRRTINRFNKEDEDDDDYQSVNEPQSRRKKPVSRYTAFARKGVPGKDFPVFTYIPQTKFDCGVQPGAGVYADPYTDCQVWHMCPGGNLSPRHSFLCPNGTIFNQKKRICDWWYNVDCRKHTRHDRSIVLYPLDLPDKEIIEEIMDVD